MAAVEEACDGDEETAKQIARTGFEVALMSFEVHKLPPWRSRWRLRKPRTMIRWKLPSMWKVWPQGSGLPSEHSRAAGSGRARAPQADKKHCKAAAPKGPAFCFLNYSLQREGSRKTIFGGGDCLCTKQIRKSPFSGLAS